MAKSVSELDIRILFDGKGALKGISNITGELDKLQKQSGKTDTSFNSLGPTTNSLIPKFAGMAAGLVSVGAAGKFIFDSAMNAGKFAGLKQGFDNLGESIGFNSQSLNLLRDATDNTMNSMDLMQQANNAMLLGIVKSDEEMAGLFDTAQRLAKAMGKDTVYGIESLVTGLGRQSRLMLDNLGLIVKHETAHKNYAAAIGTTVNKLTDEQKARAFIIEGMEQAERKAAALGDEQLHFNDTVAQSKVLINEVSLAIGDWIGSLDGLAWGINRVLEEFITWNSRLRDNVDLLHKDWAPAFREAALEVAKYDEAIRLITDNTDGWRRMVKDLGIEIKFLEGKTSLLTRLTELQTEAQEALNKSLEEYNDLLPPANHWMQMLTDSALGFSEVVEDGFSFGDSIVDHAAAIQLLTDLYNQSTAAKLAEAEAQLAVIDAYAFNIGLTEEQAAAYDVLLDKIDRLNGKQKEGEKSNEKLTKTMVKNAIAMGQAYEHVGKAAEAAAREEIVSQIRAAVAGYIAEFIKDTPLPIWIGAPLGLAAGAAFGSLMGQTVSNLTIKSFRHGVTDFEGGLAYVHKDEALVNMAPGTTVHTATETKSLFKDPELLAEVGQLRSEVRGLGDRIAGMTLTLGPEGIAYITEEQERHSEAMF